MLLVSNDPTELVHRFYDGSDCLVMWFQFSLELHSNVNRHA